MQVRTKISVPESLAAWSTWSMGLCLACVRILRGSLLNNAYSHISQEKFRSKNPRICILINLLTFETQRHTMIWKQVSKGPPFAEVGPSAKMPPLHTWDGTIAASGLTCPRRGGGPPRWSHLRGAALGQESREQLQQSSQHSAPKSCGPHADSTEGTLKTMGNNTAPVPWGHQAPRTDLQPPP